MKLKSIALLLIFLLMGITVYSENSNTDIAFFKPCTASSFYRNDYKYSPYKAVDNDFVTGFVSDSIFGKQQVAWWQIDLGKTYDVNKISISFRDAYPEERRNFLVLASQTPDFKENIILGERGAGEFDYQLNFERELRLNKKIRYIKIIKTVHSELLGFLEFGAYSKDGDEIDGVAKPTEIDSSWSNISVGKKITASSSHPSGSVEAAADNSNATYWTVNGADDAGKISWLQIDLERAYKILGIEVVRRQDISTERRNFKILASNDPDFKNSVVLLEVGETPYAVSVFEAVSEKLSYRYVRAQKTKVEGFGLSELKVFSLAPPPPPPVKASPELIVNFKNIVPTNTEGQIKIFKDNKIVELKNQPVLKNGVMYAPLDELLADTNSKITNQNNCTTIKNGALKIVYYDKTLTVNGKKQATLAEPFLENGIEYFPVRLIYEKLGCMVQWNSENKTVVVNTIHFDTEE